MAGRSGHDFINRPSRQISVAEPILTLTGVSKSFPGVRALNDVSLSHRARPRHWR